MSAPERRTPNGERAQGRRATDKAPIDELTKLVETMDKRHQTEMKTFRLAMRRSKIENRVMYALTFLAFVAGGAVYSHEADVREDGQCRIFEGAQREEREELADTYAYLYGAQLRGVKPGEDQLYDFALSRLPVTLDKAREDQAPGYCDQPDVGEPEPDPPMPERPRGLELPPLPPG